MNFRQFKSMYAKKRLKLLNNDQERIPEHLIFANILPRLPAKSLVRFKSVCKSWQSGISDPVFQKTHLQFSSRIPKFLLIHADWPLRMFLLSYNESEKSVFDLEELHCHDLEKQSNDNFFVVGTCNGLLCLNLKDLEMFSLWNPGTNHYETIPRYSEMIDDIDDVVEVSLDAVGFGYVSSIDDYKILALYKCWYDDDEDDDNAYTYFYVFSLNAWEWRRLDHLDGTYYASGLCGAIATCIDGILYWPFMNSESIMVGLAGFDLRSDDMTEVVEVPWLPYYRVVDEICKMRGCLSLCCRKEGSHVVDVWIFKQQSGPKTWLKLFSIDQIGVFVLGFTGNGMCLVQDYVQLKLIDPNQQDIDLLENGANCEWEIVQAMNHVESLMGFQNSNDDVKSDTP